MTGQAGKGVSESEFHMWRAIFAIAHADDVITDEERRFLTKALNDGAFSPEQRAVLEKDIDTAQSIPDMFERITDQDDRNQFFYFARMLLWCDGDFAQQEQKILTELGKKHLQSVDFDRMVSKGNLHLEFEEDHNRWLAEDMKDHAPHKGLGGIMDRFLGRFRA